MRILINAESLPGSAYHPKANASQVPKPAASCFLVGPGKEEEDSVLCPLGLWSAPRLWHGHPRQVFTFSYSLLTWCGCKGATWAIDGPFRLPVCPPQGQRVTLPCGLLDTIRQRWPGTSRPGPGDPGGSAQEEEQAQRSFLQGLISLFQGSCLASQAPLSACGSRIPRLLKLLLLP